MKITVLQTSPNVNGTSNTLAGSFVVGAAEAGNAVRLLFAGRKAITPCDLCDAGINTEFCAVQDEMQKIQGALLESDMIVFVTPIYFGDISCKLRTIIGRLYCLYSKLQEKRLKSLLLATSWRPEQNYIDYPLKVYNGLARFLHFDNLGAIIACGCSSRDELRAGPYAQQAYEFGLSLTPRRAQPSRQDG